MKKENYFGVALFIVITLQIFSNNKKNLSNLLLKDFFKGKLNAIPDRVYSERFRYIFLNWMLVSQSLVLTWHTKMMGIWILSMLVVDVCTITGFCWNWEIEWCIWKVNNASATIWTRPFRRVLASMMSIILMGFNWSF